MYIGANGLIAGHEATVPQLLIVVQGEGWVSGSDGVRTRIKQGQLAFWNGGEWHETTSELGMTAIILELDQLATLEGLQEVVNNPRSIKRDESSKLSNSFTEGHR